MLDPAEEWDEATHHAVENRAINRPKFQGEGGGGMLDPAEERDEATHHAVEKGDKKSQFPRRGGVVILREAFGCS